MSTPEVKMDLLLATVYIVGLYTWGLGQAKVISASIRPTTGPDPWLLQSWDLTSVDLLWWPSESRLWQIPRQVTGIPTAKVQQEQCQSQHDLKAHRG